MSVLGIGMMTSLVINAIWLLLLILVWFKEVKFRQWELGWARNVAIGVIWTKDRKVAIFFLGLCLSNFPDETK